MFWLVAMIVSIVMSVMMVDMLIFVGVVVVMVVVRMAMVAVGMGCMRHGDRSHRRADVVSLHGRRHRVVVISC